MNYYLISEDELNEWVCNTRGYVADYTKVPENAVGFLIIDANGLKSVRTWDDKHRLLPLQTFDFGSFPK